MQYLSSVFVKIQLDEKLALYNFRVQQHRPILLCRYKRLRVRSQYELDARWIPMNELCGSTMP